MKIRRYVGQDINEAMLKVKLDLGEKAVIVSTGTIKYPGFWGIFRKPQVEVLAILDENEVVENEKEDEDEERKEIDEAKEKSVEETYSNALDVDTNNFDKEIPKCQVTETIKYERNKTWQEESKEIKNNSKVVEDNEKDKEIIELQRKLKDMESIINNQTAEPVEVVGMNEEYYRPYQIFTNSLLRNEVEPRVVKKIIDGMDKEYAENTSVSDLAERVNNSIKNFLGVSEGINMNKNGKAKVILFAGPTGVGKTTTIAKIASDFVLKKQKKVGLITADTFRIAAVEQLKTYANILNIPLRIIYSPSEIKNAIDEFSDKDVILVDTAGRNHKNKEQFAMLRDIVKKSNPDETYLLISANTGIRDCKDIVESYKFLPNNKILFTKLDETSSYGIILNVKDMTDNPLSYITTGQDVPEDIEQIDVEKIAKILLGSNIND